MYSSYSTEGGLGTRLLSTFYWILHAWMCYLDRTPLQLQSWIDTAAARRQQTLVVRNIYTVMLTELAVTSCSHWYWYYSKQVSVITIIKYIQHTNTDAGVNIALWEPNPYEQPHEKEHQTSIPILYQITLQKCALYLLMLMTLRFLLWITVDQGSACCNNSHLLGFIPN